nr:phosphotransferase [Actinopolymorpha pittospori]
MCRKQQALPESAVGWVSEVLGSPIRSVRALTGGMDSTIDVLVPERGKPVVMRRYLDKGSPDSAIALACREAEVLRALKLTSVAAPGLVAVDRRGEHCGTPSVLTEFMDGSREVPGDPRTLAAGLARTMATIHDTSPQALDDGLPDATGLVLSALSEECPDLHDQSPSATMWGLVRDQPARSEMGPKTLIHNDFAPHNTLFVGDRLSGVVDWTLAAAGHPASEVSFCRLNVALVLGLDAGDLVLEAYEAQIGVRLTDRGWWDLVAAARVEPDLHSWGLFIL